MRAKVQVIGMGIDGLAGLSDDVRQAIAEADVVVGGRRHLEHVGPHPGRRLLFTGDLTAPIEAVAEALAMGQRVVVLASGDPNFFGVAERLRQRLGAERVEVVPNLASVQIAFARIGAAWQDVTFLSAHGRPLLPVLQMALQSQKLAILTDEHQSPAMLARALLAHGMEEDAPSYLCEALGGPNERVRSLPLREVVDVVADPLALLVVLRRNEAGGRALDFAQPAEAFQKARGQITKGEVRAVSLGKLGLRPFGVLWDVGAGAGSLAVAAAELVPRARIFAVERDREQLCLLRQNRERHLAANVEIVEGEAPEALSHLPDPHSVFLGGSGGRLLEILRLLEDRLRPGGRLVANFAVLDHLLAAEAELRRVGWPTEVVELFVTRSRRLAEGLHLEPEHPVFILSAVKGGA